MNKLLIAQLVFAIGLFFTSCSTTEDHYDDVIDGLDDVCDNLDYILDDSYAAIINNYADNIEKYEEGTKADFFDLFDELTITYPYDYVVSGVVSGLLGDFGDLLVMANDETIRSKSKSDVLKKIKSNMTIDALLVYIALVQKEGSLVYCFETSGLSDNRIEFTAKNLESILADYDYNQLVNTHEDTSSDYNYTTDNSGSKHSSSELVRMRGKVGGKYPVVMELDMADWSDITGRYRYTSTGSGNWLYLKGEYYKQHLMMKEYTDKGECTGSWEGNCFDAEDIGWCFEGTMTNSKGQTFNVELQ